MSKSAAVISNDIRGCFLAVLLSLQLRRKRSSFFVLELDRTQDRGKRRVSPAFL